ncbi:MAG: PA14 domain-containing protein [Caldilineaceae bacterium]
MIGALDLPVRRPVNPLLRGTPMSMFFRRSLTLLLLLTLLLPLAQAAQAQDYQPRFTDPGWQASYWNNRSLAGAPTLQRTDDQLNFNWGLGAPDPSLPVDNFSARWTRTLTWRPAPIASQRPPMTASGSGSTMSYSSTSGVSTKSNALVPTASSSRARTCCGLSTLKVWAMPRSK